LKYLLSAVFIIGAIITMSFTNITFEKDEGVKQEKWIADETSKKLTNPQSGKSSIKKGAAIYKTRCVVCHGAKGTGDGPAAKALKPKPANHTSSDVQKQTDGEIYWKISEGRGPMVGWKLILSEEDRWNLVNFIRTLKAD